MEKNGKMENREKSTAPDQQVAAAVLYLKPCRGGKPIDERAEQQEREGRNRHLRTCTAWVQMPADEDGCPKQNERGFCAPSRYPRLSDQTVSAVILSWALQTPRITEYSSARTNLSTELKF